MKLYYNCPICGAQPQTRVYGINAGIAFCRGSFLHRHKKIIGKVDYAQPSELYTQMIYAWNDEVAKAQLRGDDL